VFFTGTQLGPLFGRFTHDGVLVLAGALCAARVVLRKDERLAWGLIAAGIFAWAFGECYYTSVLWTVAVLPLPSPADAGYLLLVCARESALAAGADQGGNRALPP